MAVPPAALSRSALAAAAPGAWRFVRGLRRYLSEPMSRDEALALLARQCATRDDRFLDTLRRGVFADDRSPYRRLCERAGVTFGDVEAIVRRDGVEAALERLFDADVYVTLDEFKGLRPITRRGFELAVSASDFDNPLVAGMIEARGGGSRSLGRRLTFDFDHLTDDVPAHVLLTDAFGASAMPLVLWRPAPPGVAGLRRAIVHAKAGGRIDAWFTQSPLPRALGELPQRLITESLSIGSRGLAARIPRPQYVPIDRGLVVARHLGALCAAGEPAHLQTSVSAAVRVVLAAREAGIDISGTFVGVGGEPLTEQRARLIEDAGCRVSTLYSMTDCGQIGVGCADRRTADDVHLLDGKIAIVQRDHRPGEEGRSVTGAVYCTTLLSSSPKLLLNMETGDSAVLEARGCRCPSGSAGLRRHLSDIRSYEKLTTEGMHFAGERLLALVERDLPGRFGGAPTDYQLVEDRRGALSKIRVVVSPRVSLADEAGLVAFVLDRLSEGPSGGMMAAYVSRAGSLVVERREPFATTHAKIPPLHVIDG